ncbi:MAG: hypothetical protein KY456_00610, partial [Chloroflexi bacterium]|nr:hypothetical protein [Chloroflexota bacterium]
MGRIRIRAFVATVVLSTMLALPGPLVQSAAAVQDATPVAGDAGEGSVLLFAAPGMRSDLVESFATEGALPAMSVMLTSGTSADGGLL